MFGYRSWWALMALQFVAFHAAFALMAAGGVCLAVHWALLAANAVLLLGQLACAVGAIRARDSIVAVLSSVSLVFCLIAVVSVYMSAAARMLFAQ